MSTKEWAWLSYLDALRPEPGWNVDTAVLTTYSADCVSLVAAMLALAGLDDDRGSGSKVDFVNAFDQLKGRLHVLVQSGRVSVPRKRMPVLRLLDRFVVQVESDERECSWHPKLALVRLTAKEQALVQWRLWVGSRNLTRDTALDTGLLFVGQGGSLGCSIDGLVPMAKRLFARAGHASQRVEVLCKELSRIKWASPAGVTPTAIRLWEPGDARGWPRISAEARELWVVSPFLDVSTVKQLGASGRQDAQRYLVSTPNELARLGTTSIQSMEGYLRVLSFDSPPAQPGEAGAEEADEEVKDTRDEEEVAHGLHAKIVAAKVGHNWTVWMGSANATHRGWYKNHELMIALECGPRVVDGLLASLHAAREFDVQDVPDLIEESDVEMRLEACRKVLIAEWAPNLVYGPGRGLLDAKAPPPIDVDMTLMVGWLGAPTTTWLPDLASIQLDQSIEDGATALLEVYLRLGELKCSWLQRVAWDQEMPEDRDLHVISRFLDHRTFMSWLRDMLIGQAMTDGGGDWNGVTPKSRPARVSGSTKAAPWMPTLEEVLRASTAQPEVLEAVDRRFQRYLKHVPSDVPPEDLKAINEFGDVWRLVRSELLPEPPR